jgi:hypothetical protein
MEGLHVVGGHLLKDKYQIFVLCMMCIVYMCYNVIIIVCVYCMYVLLSLPHKMCMNRMLCHFRISL